MRHIRLLIPAAVVGIVFGVLLLTRLSDEALRRLLGMFSLVAAGYKLANDSLRGLRYTWHDWHGYVAGWTAGFSSALANAGGPPFTAYMLLQKVTPMTFIGTSTLFFAIVNALKLPVYLTGGVIDVPQVLGIAWALPLIPLGVWLGRGIIQRMNRAIFEWFMLITLVWAGLSLLFG